MAQDAALAYRPLQLARAYVDWVRGLLEGEADPDELLDAVEEWTPFRRYLRDAAREDREAALALAREVFADRARLAAQGFPVPESWEAFLQRLGL
ncbi:MAG: hypothetical protein ACP5JV_05610 [Thermus sp.]|uniref:hypothetical protein n=1 Tax=Thermus sp. TaxID=275 RepID=UPI003D0C684C